MAQISYLYAEGNPRYDADGIGEIRSLAGLEWAVNLAVLKLPSHKIKDLTPLAGLTKLRVLGLGGSRGPRDAGKTLSNDISNLTPLMGLINLTELDLTERIPKSEDGNKITDEQREMLEKALPWRPWIPKSPSGTGKGSISKFQPCSACGVVGNIFAEACLSCGQPGVW